MIKFLSRYMVLSILFSPVAFAADSCNVSVSKPWGSNAVRVEAFSNGPDCVNAVVGIVVRGAKGKVLFQSLYAAEYVGTFTTLVPAPLHDMRQMRTQLLDWIAAADEQKQDRMKNYPDWKAGAEGPATEPPAEFPFTVSSDVSREDYLQWRKANLPVLCYVQGIESENCLALKKDGTVVEIGTQSFPG